VTCPTSDEAIAVLPGECLALVNTDWHVLRAKAPTNATPDTPSPPAPPNLDEDDFEALT
jgi:hypothetical protein